MVHKWILYSIVVVTLGEVYTRHVLGGEMFHGQMPKALARTIRKFNSLHSTVLCLYVSKLEQFTRRLVGITRSVKTSG